jgi:hypothetical protein
MDDRTLEGNLQSKDTSTKLTMDEAGTAADIERP